MAFSKVVEKRRSIRRFKLDPVKQDLIDIIFESVRMAPSAGNLQPYHFIVVTDAEKKKNLGLPEWAEEAPLIIVGCTDQTLSHT